MKQHWIFPKCHGLTPASSWAPHSCSLTLPPRMGERIIKVKVRKLMGWDKDSLIGKAKATQASKAKQGIHSLTSHQQAGVQPSPGEQGSTTCVMVTWEDKRHQLWMSLPSFFFPQLYAEHDVIWYGISLWSVGVSCPSSVPSQLLVPPQPARWWGGVRGRRRPWLCVSCSASN